MTRRKVLNTPFYGKNINDIIAVDRTLFNQIFNIRNTNVFDEDERLRQFKMADESLFVDKIRDASYKFDSSDTDAIKNFIKLVNSVYHASDRINNISNAIENHGFTLHDLMNDMREGEYAYDEKYNVSAGLKGQLPTFFSIVKHIQNRNKYPIAYKFWKEQYNDYLGREYSYENLCDFCSDLKTWAKKEKLENKTVDVVIYTFFAYVSHIVAVANVDRESAIVKLLKDFGEHYVDAVIYAYGDRPIPTAVQRLIDEKRKIKTKTPKNTKLDASETSYFLLVCDPTLWNPIVHDSISYDINRDGRPKKNRSSFEKAKLFDKVLVYSTKQNSTLCPQGCVSLFEVSKESDGDTIEFQKIQVLKNVVSFNKMVQIEGINNATVQCSFCDLTPEQYNKILEMAEPGYNKQKFLEEVFMTSDDYDNLRGLLLNKKNIILQGAPGVGKTFTAKRLAYSIIGEKEDDRIMQVQFHQSYSYEDFIQGYKPTDIGGFRLEDGVFKLFCDKAKNDPGNEYFFIIDEINRGNISKIIGELMMLIEKDYRGENNAIKLAYDKKDFYVPENVYIIGMMNTADRSLALIDYALRRRFSFYEVKPCLESNMIDYVTRDFNADDKKLFEDTISIIKDINKEINEDASLGSGFCIGHSYFMSYGSGSVADWLEGVKKYDIEPILREYWVDDDDKYKSMRSKLL